MTATYPCCFHYDMESNSYRGVFPDFEPRHAHIYSVGDSRNKADAAKALALALEMLASSTLPDASDASALSCDDGFVALITASIGPEANDPCTK